MFCGVMPSRPAVSRSIVDEQSDAVILLIAGHVAQFRQLLQPLHEARHPLIEQRLVRRVERVLILRPADAVFHRQILHRLHEELDSRNLLQIRLPAAG